MGHTHKEKNTIAGFTIWSLLKFRIQALIKPFLTTK